MRSVKKCCVLKSIQTFLKVRKIIFECPKMSIKAISRDNVHLICSAQVILSPAIALKELLENAIDAKATNIEVKLQDHGSKMITVNDNGCGIKESDFVGLSRSFGN